MVNIEEIAQHNQLRALQVIEQLRIKQLWQESGATVNQVGSLAMGLLMKHRDIDFHVYTDQLDLEASFQVVKQICANSRIVRFDYRNLADTCEKCLEFHFFYLDDEQLEWQIDVIQILRHSEFDGYFEHVAERIKAVLTPQTRRTILELKYATADSEHIMGIEYYQAVLAYGIDNYPDFMAWRAGHPVAGIVDFCP